MMIENGIETELKQSKTQELRLALVAGVGEKKDIELQTFLEKNRR